MHHEENKFIPMHIYYIYIYIYIIYLYTYKEDAQGNSTTTNRHQPTAYGPGSIFDP